MKEINEDQIFSSPIPASLLVVALSEGSGEVVVSMESDV